MTADLVYLVAGLCLLLAIVLPELLSRWAVSAPMVLVAVGTVIGLTPLADGMPLDPRANRVVIEHVTELVVLVALMGVGLALDRPFSWRERKNWPAWAPTLRLIVVAMPLAIGAVALLAWGTGIPLASALVLGGVLAPTDPVLASDVQVAGPQVGDHEVDETDELRFTLTSEAGLNDGLASPFVWGAILVASSPSWGSLGEWLGWYVVGKVVLGVLAGFAVGRGLAAMAFRSRSASLRVAERQESLMALATLLASYGVGQVIGGYGFLAVFVSAMTFRGAERGHEYHAAMHAVVERLERLLTLFVLLVLGIALTRGLLAGLDWRGVLVGLGLILVIRPICGFVALAVGTDGEARHGRLSRSQQAAAAFFGVRGVGTIYYVAFAAGQAPGLAVDWLWSTVAFTVVASVLIHGVLSTPVMSLLDRWHGHPAGTPTGSSAH